MLKSLLKLAELTYRRAADHCTHVVRGEIWKHSPDALATFSLTLWKKKVLCCTRPCSFTSSLLEICHWFLKVSFVCIERPWIHSLAAIFPLLLHIVYILFDRNQIWKLIWISAALTLHSYRKYNFYFCIKATMDLTFRSQPVLVLYSCTFLWDRRVMMWEITYFSPIKILNAFTLK